MKIKKPTLEEINDIDMSVLLPLFNFFPDVKNGDKFYLNEPGGHEHYKLLGWLSNQFNNSIISEVGTCDGMGLLSLSLNKSNQVLSYDIMDYERKHKVPSNVKRIICDMVFNYFDDVIKSKIIFYDASHNGKDEMFFVKKLMDLNYRGILVFDDINFNNEMREFWSQVKSLGLNCEDWTDIGHINGTGLIFF